LKKVDPSSNDSDLPINERMEVCVAEAKLDLTQILEALPDARILAAADVLDATACFPPYRRAVGLQAALAELNFQQGKQFDAAVVDACTRGVSTDRVDLGLPE
jgi:hypothetical protein